MGPTDARRLSAESLEDLRRRVVAAVDGGMTQIEAARAFGVSRRAVGVWVRAHRVAGEAAFRPGRRGRASGDQFALPLPVQAQGLAVLAAGPPEDAGLAHPLWTRRAVSDLLDRETGLHLSPTTVGHYLTRWGLAAEAAVRQAWGGPVGRELWRVVWTRPAEDSLGSLLLPGGPPEVLLAASARGSSAFLLAEAPFTAEAAGDFGERLSRQAGRDVHLLVCGWPAEHADALHAWARGARMGGGRMGGGPIGGPVRVSFGAE